MPISVLPTPPDFPPSKPPTKPARTTSKAHVNHDPADEYTAVDIDPITALKEQAKSSVQSSAKGFSALALLKSARDQYLRATTCENQGDLKGALVALTKAAGLTQMVFRTAEWGQNGQNAVKKELMDLKDKDLTSRMQAVEAKLRLLEKENTSSKSTTSNEGSSVSQKSGGSIADRMKALQNSGLSITTASKRFSKDLHTDETPISATSPTPAYELSPPSSVPSASSSVPSPNAFLTSGTSSASTSASSTSSSSSLYGHAFVSPSTLGPPSPESSPSSSPTLPIRSFSSSSEFNAFNAQFPSIDELNEADDATSSPFNASGITSSNTGSSTRSPVPLASPLPALNGTPQTPHATLRNFIVPVLERPSSTPSTPLRTSGGIWDSRPGSPTPTANPPPLALLNRPSGLSTSRSLENSDDSPPSTSSPVSSSSRPTSLPTSRNGAIPQKNICTPKELYHYLQDHEVILLDVRERAEFEKGHIVLRRGSRKVSCAVCIEPSVLQRENVTSDTIEDSLSLAPTSEASAFNNRHKFELLVLYDQNSTSFNMSILLRAIWEREFKKTLRRTPMMLVGGYDAWVKEFGIEHMRIASSVPLTETSTNGTIPSSISIPPPLPSTTNHISQGRNPFAPGGPLSSHVPVTSSNTTTSPLQPIQPSLSRHQTGVSPSSSASSHSRAPAESSSHSSLSGRGTPSYSPSMPPSPHFSGPGMKRPPVIGRTSFSSTSATNGAIPIGTSGPMTALPEGDMGPTIVSGATPITYPVFSSHISYPIPLASSSSATIRSPAPFDGVNKIEGLASPPPLPPQASINPSVARRRTSDYVDQSQEALSGMNRSTNTASSISRKPIDYPELSSTHPILRPPPAAAAGALERQENIKRYPTPPPLRPVPRLKGGEWTPRYWADSPIGTSGLKNMGNTCYMNAPIQCLSATVPFARFFTEVDLKSVINYMNKMNSKGQLTKAFSRLVHDIWHADMPYITPNDFRRTLCSLNAQYMGTSQHDSQEFLSFLLDGIHEDTNRIMSRTVITRTPAEEERLENMPQQIAGEYEWQVWRQNNDSIIVDFFQGMFRNQLRCMKCEKTSTTYNAFSILSVPVPARTGKIPLQNCLKAFFNVEVMEGDDAWDCPRCKSKRRATKTLSLARLPPVLVIHLKRFEANGRFSDKIDTFVDFPIKGLDLTELMPPPLPVGADQSLLNGGMVNSVLSRDDPRIQLGPYKYELYAVTNHFGNLSSGHYTAFVASRGGWLSCDDSSVKNADIKQVVNQKAYVLFYKRART
ncbi:ubiquitin carboxyl-terminal hydrolase 4 [Lentinula raphanica]|nr:ubiquitin carboxyl-terminal hydrolase 4 [Lentinula raphanica]